MKFSLFSCLAATLLLLPTHASQGAQDPISLQIDRLVAENYRAQGIKPNPPISDEVFARRIYLDIIGRIPTQQELDAFLNAKSKTKRSKLIDYLLDSENRSTSRPGSRSTESIRRSNC